jgi:hypothetical protein
VFYNTCCFAVFVDYLGLTNCWVFLVCVEFVKYVMLHNICIVSFFLRILFFKFNFTQFLIFFYLLYFFFCIFFMFLWHKILSFFLSFFFSFFFFLFPFFPHGKLSYRWERAQIKLINSLQWNSRNLANGITMIGGPAMTAHGSLDPNHHDWSQTASLNGHCTMKWGHLWTSNIFGLFLLGPHVYCILKKKKLLKIFFILYFLVQRKDPVLFKLVWPVGLSVQCDMDSCWAISPQIILLDWPDHQTVCGSTTSTAPCSCKFCTYQLSMHNRLFLFLILLCSNCVFYKLCQFLSWSLKSIWCLCYIIVFYFVRVIEYPPPLSHLSPTPQPPHSPSLL